MIRDIKVDSNIKVSVSVPSLWTEGKVSDVVKALESGVSVNGEDRKRLSSEKGVLKVSAVSYGYFDEFAQKVISVEGEFARAKTHPKIGQVIISRSNTEELVGASAYIDKNYDYLFLSDKLWQTIPYPKSNMKWLSYVLASDKSRYTLSKLATGTSGSMKNITKGELLGLKVLIPPPLEQKKIAKILSTWDRAIEVTEKLLNNSQQQKKSLMQQLLTGKKRLPGFSGDWEDKNINALVKIVYGKSPKDIFIENGKYPVIGTGGITGRTNTTICKQNAVVIGRKGTIDKPRYIEQPFWAIDTTFFCISEKGCDIKWFYYLICSINLRKYNESSGVPSLSRENVRAIKAVTPEIDEQQKIASILSTADKEIETLQQKLNHLEQEKKALMQQLLTGKRRVAL